VVALVLIETVSVGFAESAIGLRNRACELALQPPAIVAMAAPPGPSAVPDLDASAGPALPAGAIVQRTGPSTVILGVHRRYGLDPTFASAVVLNSDGLLLTTEGDIFEADRIVAQVGADSTLHEALLVGTDESDDIALLQLQRVSGLTPARFAATADAQEGDPVFAVENLGQQGITARPGTISVPDLPTPVLAGGEWPGVSDVRAVVIDGEGLTDHTTGTVVDPQGRVLGLMVGSNDQDVFAITAQAALAAARLIAGGHAGEGVTIGRWATLGVVTRDATGGHQGAEVVTVHPGTPGYCLGLLPGDVIQGAAGVPITSAVDLAETLFHAGPGARTTFTWVAKNGLRRSAAVTLAAGTGP
jgi:S1-C subfamily serine protease